MKRLTILSLALLLLLPLARAEERVWCLITDSGESVAMSEVLCLAAADDVSTFAVVLKEGEAIAGVRCARFGMEIPTGICPSSLSHESVPASVSSSSSMESFKGFDPSLISPSTAAGVIFEMIPDTVLYPSLTSNI